MMEDRATRGLEAMSRQAQGTSRSLTGVGDGLMRIVGLAAGAFTFAKAKDALLGYNSEMEQARLTTAAMLDLYSGNSGNMASQIGNANVLMGQLVQRAKTSTATTEELVKFMTQVVGPVKQAGMQTKELADFTASAVIAAKAFNIEGEVAARDIQQGLLRGARNDDLFSKQLLGAMHMTTEEFNKLSTAQRLATFQAALKHKTITDLGISQANTFAGIWSTIKDQIQIALGQVGAPLFKAMTADMIKLNQWIEKNSGRISDWAVEFGRAIRDGYEKAKQMVGWIIEHKDILLALAKGWLAMKGAQAIGGPLLAAQQIFNALKEGSMSSAMKLNALALAVGAAVVALEWFISKMENRQEEGIQKQVDRHRMTEDIIRAGGGNAGSAASLFNSKSGTFAASGFMNKDGSVNKQAMRNLAASMSDTELQKYTGSQYNTHETAGVMIAADMLEQSVARGMELAKSREAARSARDDFAKGQAMGRGILASVQELLTESDRLKKLGAMDMAKPNVNVRIERIEAKSEDPDRFIFQLQSALEDVARNPSSAFDAMRHG